MFNCPPDLRGSKQSFDGADIKRVQSDEILRNQLVSWITSQPDYELLKAGEISPAVFYAAVTANSSVEISAALQVVCMVLLGAFVMQGCGVAKINVEHPVSDDAFADAGTDASTDASISSDEAIDSQKSNIEWLPGYPISKKIAVIINGDSRKKRHKKNVERAIRLFQIQEFDEIFVAQDASVKDKEDIHQYTGTKNGLDELFVDLKESLIKDSLVFVYGTGHGQEEENGAIALDEPIGEKEIRDYMKTIKEGESRIVAVFDSCYSGSFPNAIIEDEKLEGAAMSPGVVDEKTCCKYFAPNFFEGLERGADLNNDGKTEINEAFVSAMQNYRHETNTDEYGEYVRSKTELSLENFDRFANSEKTLIIDVNATWCGPCRILSEQLSKLVGLVGEQIEVVTITDDKNPEAKELYERLGIEKPDTFPLMLIKKPGADSDLDAFEGAKSYSKLTKLLESQYGVEVDNEQFFSTLISNEIENDPDHEEEIRFFIEQFGTQQAWLLRYINFEKVGEDFEKLSSLEEKRTYLLEFQESTIRRIVSKRPTVVMSNFDKFREKAYAEEIVRKILERNTVLVLKYSDHFKDQPYYKKILKRILASCLRWHPEDVLKYCDKFADQPFARRIIIATAKEEPGQALKYSDNFRNQSYYEELLKRAAFDAADRRADEAFKYSDKFKGRPYHSRILSRVTVECARVYPDDILQYSDKIEGKPYYLRILEKAARTAAKKHPVDALKYSDKFKDQPYAESLIRSASEKNPALALVCFDKFKDQPYTESIIRSISEKKPGDILNRFEKYKDQPYAESLIRTIFEKYPADALLYSEKYKDQPYHAEVLEKAVRISAVQFPDRAFVFSDEYKDQPYYEEMLEKVTRIGAEKFPTLLITHFDKFKDQLYAEEVIRIVCEKEPIYAIVYSKKFKDQTYYAEILEKAVRIGVEKDPVEVFGRSGPFEDQPYYEEVIEQAIPNVMEKFPLLLVTYKDTFKDHPHYEEILEEAIRKSIHFSGTVSGMSALFMAMNPGIFGPVGMLHKSDKFKDKPYYEEILEEAVREVLRKYPEQLFAYVDKFRDRPYTKEVLFEAANKIYQHSTRVRMKNYPELKSLPYYKDLLKLEKKLRREHKNKKRSRR